MALGWTLTKRYVLKLDALEQWCLWKLLGIQWYHHVWNDEVRQTTGQPHLSAIVQARRFSQFGHIARMPDETDAKKLLTASTWRTGRPHTKWMKTIQQDLMSNNLTPNEAIDVAQNHLWRLIVQCFTSPPTQYRLYGRRNSGDWCLRLAVCTRNGAYHKRWRMSLSGAAVVEIVVMSMTVVCVWSWTVAITLSYIHVSEHVVVW